MQVKKEELQHIANLADLEINDNEIETYLQNLQNILDFAEIINKAPVENLDITVGANEIKNVLRKDEINIFEDNKALLQNAPEEEQNMFKIPKVL